MEIIVAFILFLLATISVAFLMERTESSIKDANVKEAFSLIRTMVLLCVGLILVGSSMVLFLQCAINESFVLKSTLTTLK
jgi:uncharacterized membrane protein